MRRLRRASTQPARPLAWLGVAAWLSLWVLTLPLFHIHAVAEVQQGVAHTVFSPDLPGEYAAGLPQALRSTSTTTDQRHDSLSGGRSYPELAFTTPLPQAGHSHKPVYYHAYVSLALSNSPELTRSSPRPDDVRDDPQRFLDTGSPRAPPHCP